MCVLVWVSGTETKLDHNIYNTALVAPRSCAESAVGVSSIVIIYFCHYCLFIGLIILIGGIFIGCTFKVKLLKIRSNRVYSCEGDASLKWWENCRNCQSINESRVLNTNFNSVCESLGGILIILYNYLKMFKIPLIPEMLSLFQKYSNANVWMCYNLRLH